MAKPLFTRSDSESCGEFGFQEMDFFNGPLEFGSPYCPPWGFFPWLFSAQADK